MRARRVKRWLGSRFWCITKEMVIFKNMGGLFVLDSGGIGFCMETGLGWDLGTLEGKEEVQCLRSDNADQGKNWVQGSLILC